MADPSLERGAQQPTGRFGRPTKPALTYTFLAVGVAAVAGYAFSTADPNPQMPTSFATPEMGEIGPPMKMNVALPVAPPVQPPQEKAATPPMPATFAGLPSQGTAQQEDRPQRVTSFRSTRYQQAGGPAAPAPAAPQASAVQAPPQAAEGTRITFAAKEMPGLKAGPAVDMTYVLRPGVYKMTLVNAVNSERSGSFFATLSQDVKSQAGVTLMERGTTIIGKYETAVGQGQERIVTSAAWALTPNGVPAPLGEATVTDESGRSGMPGAVNTHWRERWGSAFTLLLTQGAIQGATAALQSSMAQGGGNTFLNLNTSPLNQVLTDTMRGGNAIQNTVDVKAGKEIAFLLTQPVDFSAAYGLAPVEMRRR